MTHFQDNALIRGIDSAWLCWRTKFLSRSSSWTFLRHSGWSRSRFKTFRTRTLGCLVTCGTTSQAMITARSSIGSPTVSERPSESTRYAVLNIRLFPSCLASRHFAGLYPSRHRKVHRARRAEGTRVAPHAHYAPLSVQGEPSRPYRHSGKRLVLLGLRSRAVCINT